MNLVGMLAKVAMGAMVSRGAGRMLGGGSGGGLGGLGSLLGGGQQQQSGGLGGLLGGLLGGQQQHQQQGGGGIGDLLGSVLSGGGAGGGAGGGLGGLLNGLASGGQQQGGGGGLGDLLNQALGGGSVQPTQDQNNQAEVMLRGMINAAKCDGNVDPQEQEKIVEHLGDLSQDEINFVRNEFQQPLDLDGFVRSVARGSEQQVYLMSLLGIKLDSQVEAQYLDKLAKGLGISQQQANQIHAKLGVPNLYG